MRWSLIENYLTSLSVKREGWTRWPLRFLTSSNILIIQKSPAYLLLSTTGAYSQELQSLAPSLEPDGPEEGAPLIFHTYPTLPLLQLTPVPKNHGLLQMKSTVSRFSGSDTEFPQMQPPSLQVPLKESQLRGPELETCTREWSMDQILLNQSSKARGAPRYHSEETHVYRTG